MKTLKKLFIIAVSLAVWIFPAYLFGWGVLFVSFIPAIFVMDYLDYD